MIENTKNYLIKNSQMYKKGIISKKKVYQNQL